MTETYYALRSIKTENILKINEEYDKSTSYYLNDEKEGIEFKIQFFPNKTLERIFENIDGTKEIPYCIDLDKKDVEIVQVTKTIEAIATFKK